MKKQVIKMTQNGLQKLISESVRRMLKEAEKRTGVNDYYTDDKGVQKPVRGSFNGDFSQLGVEYDPFDVPGVKNREHTNLNDCTDTIRSIYNIKDARKREMAFQYLYMDLKDEALRYGKRIYDAVCARYNAYDILDESELESFLLKILNICLGIEKGEDEFDVAFNPNMEDVSFKTYYAQKISGRMRKIIKNLKKRTFYKITKYEADKMMLKRFPSKEYNKIVERIRNNYVKKEIKPGTYNSLDDIEYTTDGTITNEKHKEMMRDVTKLAMNKVWELSPERTFNSFFEIQSRQIPDVFRVKKSTTPENDDRFNINKSDDLDDPTKGDYDYYTTISKKPSNDTFSMNNLSKTLGDELSLLGSTPNYDNNSLDIKQPGESDMVYSTNEAINRIVRKVLLEMRKK